MNTQAQRFLPLFGAAALVLFATGCDTTYVLAKAKGHDTLNRSTDEIRFEITAITDASALVDVRPDRSEVATQVFFDDVPGSSLTVQITTESRGFLGLNIAETVANAWLEDEAGFLVGEPLFWLVDGSEHTRNLFLDDPIWSCDDRFCRQDLVLVVSFVDPARVRVDVEAELYVDYDGFGGSTPDVSLFLDQR